MLQRFETVTMFDLAFFRRAAGCSGSHRFQKDKNACPSCVERRARKEELLRSENEGSYIRIRDNDGARSLPVATDETVCTFCSRACKPAVGACPCGNRFYCSIECAKSDWATGHKRLCLHSRHSGYEGSPKFFVLDCGGALIFKDGIEGERGISNQRFMTVATRGAVGDVFRMSPGCVRDLEHERVVKESIYESRLGNSAIKHRFDYKHFDRSGLNDEFPYMDAVLILAGSKRMAVMLPPRSGVGFTASIKVRERYDSIAVAFAVRGSDDAVGVHVLAFHLNWLVIVENTVELLLLMVNDSCTRFRRRLDPRAEDVFSYDVGDIVGRAGVLGLEIPLVEFVMNILSGGPAHGRSSPGRGVHALLETPAAYMKYRGDMRSRLCKKGNMVRKIPGLIRAVEEVD